MGKKSIFIILIFSLIIILIALWVSFLRPLLSGRACGDFCSCHPFDGTGRYAEEYNKISSTYNLVFEKMESPTKDPFSTDYHDASTCMTYPKYPLVEHAKFINKSQLPTGQEIPKNSPVYKDSKGNILYCSCYWY